MNDGCVTIGNGRVCDCIRARHSPAIAGGFAWNRAVFAKATWRLMPFMGLLYVVAYLDRVNVGTAALTMNKDIGLTPEIYGFGAGIFFIGYFLFEVPSNVILEKVGARIWISRSC